MLSLALRSPVIRNTSFNLLGQGIPLLIGAASIPIIARSLSSEAFALLGLAWVALAYTSLFELGLGRATIKNVSALAEDYSNLPAVIWTPFWIQFGIGWAAAIAVWFLAPIITQLMNPSELYVIDLLRWLGIALPIILMTSIFRSALEGAQHFGIVNLLKSVNLAAMFLIPLFGGIQGWELIEIVVVMVMVQPVFFLGWGMAVQKKFPILRTGSLKPKYDLLRPLFSFGGWTTAYQACILVSYIDRLLLGALASLTALAYYTAAKEIISRVWIIPWSLALVLFPTFSELDATGDREAIKQLYWRATKWLALIIGPLPLLTALFAAPLLKLYLGTELGSGATAPIQILAIGLAMSSLAFTPYSLFQGLGRPDMPAKIALPLAPVHVALLVLLVPSFGATGAALSWTIWSSISAAIMAFFGWRTVRAL